MACGMACGGMGWRDIVEEIGWYKTGEENEKWDTRTGVGLGLCGRFGLKVTC